MTAATQGALESWTVVLSVALAWAAVEFVAWCRRWGR